jgi:hypothetical protein
VNELRSFAALQARMYEFLEQLDEATLHAIVSGEVQLTVVRTDDVRAPVGSVSSEDVHGVAQAARHLVELASEHERRIYLRAAGYGLKELKKIAKACGLVGYSRLNTAQLINLLSGQGSDQTDAPAGKPRTPAPARYPLDGTRAAERPAATRESPAAVDVAAIAARLRETETEEEGAAYLHAQHLDRESLLAVAAELRLTRVHRLSQTELEKRVLKQAIGARRKFDGLRRW